MSDENSAVRIQGRVLGHPIDVTITECETDPDTVTPPVETPPETVTPPVEPPVAAEVEASAIGEVTPPDTSAADPAPEVTDVTEEPKNPEGNAEQL